MRKEEKASNEVRVVEAQPPGAVQSRYLRFDDMTWPDPRAVGDLEWRLRYATGPVPDNERMFLASICAAYAALVFGADARGKMAALRRAMRAEEKPDV